MRDSLVPDDTRIRTIKGPGASLAVACSLLGRIPPEPSLGRVRRGRVCGYDLATASTTSLSVTSSGAIRLEAKGLDRRQHKERHPNHTQCVLKLEGGTLRARWSEVVNSHFAARHDATFELTRWEWTTTRKPVAWIGALSSARVF